MSPNQQQGQMSTLVTGCDLISRLLRLCVSPFGWLFRFDTKPNLSSRPRPLAFTVILALGGSSILMFIWMLIHRQYLQEEPFDHDYNLSKIQDSQFSIYLFRIMQLSRLAMQSAIVSVSIIHHGEISSVISSANYMISPQEQVELARFSFGYFIIYTITTCIPPGYLLVASPVGGSPLVKLSTRFAFGLVQFFLKLVIDAPLMYICYLGSSFGRHVGNFSQIYVESMFDQFIIESEAEGHSTKSVTEVDGSEQPNQGGLYKRIISSIEAHYHCSKSKIKEMSKRLGERSYPELPNMKMMKLSTTDNAKLTDTIRTANSRLIRVRLRKTEMMLSELRDMVIDVNKIASPIFLIHVLFSTILVIFITTSSINLKVYRSFSLMMIPTLASSLGLIIMVVQVSTSLDDTTRQLKLMINKQFDFIIMNHGGKNSSLSMIQDGGALETDDDNLSETWCQFQYVRKLSNTIQFTMGGIVPVSRRLVLSILGHVLSAVFISIEIMSIVDTYNIQS